MSVNAGAMRFSIAIQQPSTVKRPSGQPAAAWLDFATRRAAVKAGLGVEKNAAQEEIARVTTLFTLRYLEGVNPTMRIVFDNRVFDIKSAIDPDERRERLLITAEERVGEVP